MTTEAPGTCARVSIVVPCYNEGESIIKCADRIREAVKAISLELLVVYDTDEDTTRPFAEKLATDDDRICPLVNTYGRGPANAIRFGVDHASAPVVVVTMADGSDDPQQIEELVRLVERGVVVAAASRYMAGGQQVGGPLIKKSMSRLAGVSLRWLTRVTTHDSTNSFKAYDTEFVRDVGIHSTQGFEIGIELVAKAIRCGEKVAEIPTIWLDRSEGESHFHIRKWLPEYLKWYRFALGRKVTRARVRELAEQCESPLSLLPGWESAFAQRGESRDRVASEVSIDSQVRESEK